MCELVCVCARVRVCVSLRFMSQYCCMAMNDDIIIITGQET